MNSLFGFTSPPPKQQPTTNMNDLFGFNSPPPKQQPTSFSQPDFLSSPVKPVSSDPFGSLSSPTPTPKPDQTSANWNPFG